MSGKHVFSEKWPERWKQLDRKLDEMVEFVMSEEFKILGKRFLVAYNICSRCGYCEEYGCCDKCPLFWEKLCCYYKKDGSETLVWQLVKELEKRNSDQKKVIKLAEKISRRIKRDNPENQK